VSLFSDFLEAATGDSEGSIGYLSGAVGRSAVIRSGLEMGETPTGILTAMRANGLGMRTQNFYQLIHQLTPAAGGAPGWQWGGPGTSIDPRDVSQLAGGTQGKYMVNVRHYYTQSSDAGDLESGYRTTSVLQDVLDLDQAVADAQNIMANATGSPGATQGTITGVDISSVVQWQGK
jgi:hypothetical protein